MPNLSPEAVAALKDESPLKPPFSFYPRGFPFASRGFGSPPAKLNAEKLARKNWHFRPIRKARRGKQESVMARALEELMRGMK